MSRQQLLRPSGPLDGLGEDDTGCTVLHVDMDAFFASCELRERPELRGRPAVVGVAAERSVVLAATYEARRFGIHSAMPMSRALRLCPQLEVLEPRFPLYAEVSRAVMAVFADVTPEVEPLSLDEAFLDVTGAVRRLGSPRTIGEHIRARVHTEHGLTCSVGVASTKHVAKLASTRAKPDGLLVVPAAQVLEFLHPLPATALWGVGDRTAETLARLGLRTVGELAHAPLPVLQHSLGRAVGGHLHELAWGRDDRTVDAAVADKSIGAEETFATDVADLVVLRAELLRLSDRVGSRLRAGGQVGRTVAIKVRYADFTTVTRSRTPGSPVDLGRELYAVACELLDSLELAGRGVRLVGVRAENLERAGEHAEQLTFDEPDPAWRDAELVIDRASARFGPGVVRPARLVPASSGGPSGAPDDPRVTDRSLASPRPAAPQGTAGPGRPS